MTERLVHRQPWRGMLARLFALSLAAMVAACAPTVKRPTPPPPVVEDNGPVAEENRNRVAVLVPTTGPNAFQHSGIRSLEFT